jgi:hypothetical protein
MMDPVSARSNTTSSYGAKSFAEVANSPQLLAQSTQVHNSIEPNAFEVGACRAGKVAQGAAGAVEVVGGTVMAMGGAAVTVMGVAVALFETPIVTIAGGQPFWGTAAASAGVAGAGVGLSISSDGLNRIGAQINGDACNNPK